MSAQKGAGSPIIIIIVVVAIAAVAGYLIFGKSTTPPPLVQPKALNISEVENLGGTCFKTFEDEAGDVKSDAKKQELSMQVDAKKIAVGVKGDNLVVQWDLEGSIKIDPKHTRQFVINRDIGKQTIYDEISVASLKSDQSKWRGEVTHELGSENQSKESFDTNVEVLGNSIRYTIPLSVFSNDKKVDKIFFINALVDEEDNNATYGDFVIPPRSSGSPYFICSS